MLQKYFYAILGIVCFMACETSESTNGDLKPNTTLDPNQSGNDSSPSSDEFLALFETHEPDTFQVSSVTMNPNSDEFEFKGKPIPNDQAHYFDGIQAYGTFDNATDLFAVFQKPLGEQHILLLVRVPGEDWSSRMSLFVFDKNEHRLLDTQLEIAEDFEGAIGSVLREAEVQLLPGQSALIVEMNEMSCFTQSEDPNTKLCSDSLKNFVFTLDGGFEMLSASGAEMIVPVGSQ